MKSWQKFCDKIFSQGIHENLFTWIFNTWIFSYMKISRFTVHIIVTYIKMTLLPLYYVPMCNNWKCSMPVVKVVVSQLCCYLLRMYKIANRSNFWQWHFTKSKLFFNFNTLVEFISDASIQTSIGIVIQKLAIPPLFACQYIVAKDTII